MTFRPPLTCARGLNSQHRVSTMEERRDSVEIKTKLGLSNRESPHKTE